MNVILWSVGLLRLSVPNWTRIWTWLPHPPGHHHHQSECWSKHCWTVCPFSAFPSEPLGGRFKLTHLCLCLPSYSGLRLCLPSPRNNFPLLSQQLLLGLLHRALSGPRPGQFSPAMTGESEGQVCESLLRQFSRGGLRLCTS